MRRVKKSVAELLVRRLLARAVGPRLIQLVEVEEFIARTAIEAQPRAVSSSPVLCRANRYLPPERMGNLELLPPLEFYAPFVDLPYWLVALYSRAA